MDKGKGIILVSLMKFPLETKKRMRGKRYWDGGTKKLHKAGWETENTHEEWISRVTQWDLCYQVQGSTRCSYRCQRYHAKISNGPQEDEEGGAVVHLREAAAPTKLKPEGSRELSVHLARPQVLISHRSVDGRHFALLSNTVWHPQSSYHCFLNCNLGKQALPGIPPWASSAGD